MTIKDLAKRTGYGVATVSRVLNGHSNVSERAKKVILAEAKRCNFEINSNAKQLKQRYATSILVVVKGTSNEVFANLVETIQSKISKTRYPLFVDYIDEDANEVIRAINLCKEKKPLGILFLGGDGENFLADLDKIEVPCVLVSNSAEKLNIANLSSISTDDFMAAKAAADSLVALGHKNIAIIGGNRETSEIARFRYEGCMESFKESGIDFDDNLDYVGVRFSYQEGYEATEKLIKSKRKFTAIFAEADVMAIGAIRALADNGFNVPEDVSVMGFDGLTLGSYLVPKLSTVEQSVFQMAERSVKILLANIEKHTPASHERVPFAVLLRESTKKI